MKTSPQLVQNFTAMNLVKLATFAVMASTCIQAQSLVSDSAFLFDTVEARPQGGTATLSLVVNDTQVGTTPASQTLGNVSWTHGAGGLAHIGADVLSLVAADVKLRAYGGTTGSSLRFGREIVTQTILDDILPGVLNSAVNAAVNSVVGASVINSWESTASLSNLNLSQGVLYSLQFNVSTGAGLNLNALSYANFTLLNGTTPIDGINTTEVINVLDLLRIGDGICSVDLQFYAPEGLGNLSLQFETGTILNVGLLGGITGNQTVMDFSGFSLAPVPEAGSMMLAALGFMVLLRRRRPCGI